MKTDSEMLATIRSLLSQKPIVKDLGADDDFFDAGASSLTIVDLQLQIEEGLGLQVPTSDLMRFPTLNGWVHLYSQRQIHGADAGHMEIAS